MTLDAGVVQQLRSGDREALAAVFEAHAQEIYAYCHRRTASWSDAQDLAADTFVEVWRSRHRIPDHEAGIKPWLYGIAANLCRRHLRQQERGRRAMTRLGPAALGDDPIAGLIDELNDEERLAWVHARLAELPRGFADVFYLVSWQGLTYEEAAKALELPVGTVRSRLSRAREQLRLATKESAHVL